MIGQGIAEPQVNAGVRLRPLSREHLDRTLDWSNDPEAMRLLNRAQAVGRDEHLRWFESLAACEDRRYFAIEAPDLGHIGNIWLWQIDHRHRKAEVRIVIGESSGRNRGWGSQAIGQLASYAFEDLKLHRLYAFVLAFNVRAVRAFDKAGFRQEGVSKDDRWTDEGFVDAIVLGKIAG